MASEPIRAVLYSDMPPSAEQKARLAAFLAGETGAEVTLRWEEDPAITGGFRLQVGSKVYDWTAEGRMTQFREAVAALNSQEEEFIPLLRETVRSWTPKAMAQELGQVVTVGDGIATVAGLEHAVYGEILLFSSGIRGMVQDLRPDRIGCILFGDDADIASGSMVRRTGRAAGVPVSQHLLGRVVNALGAPIDGKGDLFSDRTYPLERPAPGIIHRQPVNAPLETGILAIDAMFPIGRGQRELIIGDRQTGKTAIAVDTILNQKDKNVICVYVAIGQKASSVAQLVRSLESRGAMDYTVVVNATASDPAPLQYIAPYAGCAIGEYFMEQGKDVLIIYDDLSKHAIAYRSMSLLLERAPGREAYPGDVFYLHSRLLERSAHLSDELGGGSMTALPIVETQAGDVSAYIPTNIISITDGQIFLESGLFFAGQRPAVNVGLSVSRVGGDAQTRAMKKAAGTLRLDLAQYREMEVFTQFSSDLDQQTRRQLLYGQSLMQLLRQEQYAPLQQWEQVVTLVVAMERLLQETPVAKIRPTMSGLLRRFREERPDLVREIQFTGKLEEDTRQAVADFARTCLEGG